MRISCADYSTKLRVIRIEVIVSHLLILSFTNECVVSPLATATVIGEREWLKNFTFIDIFGNKCSKSTVRESFSLAE